jgi:hypothetical protein
MLAWLVAAALAGQAPAPVAPRFAVDQSGGGLGVFVRETVAFGAYGRKGKTAEPSVWVAEQQRTDVGPRERSRKHRWIDGRSCPALATVAGELEAMLVREEARQEAADRFGVRVLDGPRAWASDTPMVKVARVDAATRPPGLSDVGGPVSRWWWRSEEILEPCWRDDAPRFGGKPAAPLIP